MAALFDSHVHLDDPDWSTSQIHDQLAQLRRDQRWSGAMLAGYGPERFAASRWICRHNQDVVRSLGLHPWWLANHLAPERDRGWAALVDELQLADAVAVGEIGLDKGLKDRFSLDDQLIWLHKGLHLSRARGLPLVLHVVGWYGHALDALRAVGGPWRGVVHRWSGPAELVQPFCALGLHISLALEPREVPDKRAAIARRVPADRLLIESDWPFGDLDYPQAVAATTDLAQRVAGWRGEDAAELLQRSSDLGRRLFGLV